MTATTATATQQNLSVQIGETYNFHLPNGDRYVGEVDETNGKYVILRPGYSGWLVEDAAPHVSPGSHVQFNINDPGVLVYDVDGEQI